MQRGKEETCEEVVEYWRRRSSKELKMKEHNDQARSRRGSAQQVVEEQVNVTKNKSKPSLRNLRRRSSTVQSKRIERHETRIDQEYSYIRRKGRTLPGHLKLIMI